MTPLNRSGVTQLEVLVAISILGLLAALLLPAVQRARATSRRTTCLSNFHQLGIALNAMAEQGEFSTGAANRSDPSELPYRSFYPYLEQTSLVQELRQGKSGPIPPVLICPSETLSDDLLGVLPNYFLNAGCKFRKHRPSNGFQSLGEANRRVSEITDGLSNTVAMSERLVAWPVRTRATMTVPELTREPLRTFWYTATRFGGRGDEPQAVAECKYRKTTPFPQFFGLGALQHWHLRGYDHMLTPNSPACYNGPEDFDIDEDLFLIPATSYHTGGVNVLMADGSAHFISEGIDSEVWNALGTRNGHEVVALPF